MPIQVSTDDGAKSDGREGTVPLTVAAVGCLDMARIMEGQSSNSMTPTNLEARRRSISGLVYI